MTPIKLIIIITAIFFIGSMSSCMDKKTSVEQTIMNLDKAGWEAWKNNDGTWFEKNTTKNFTSISASGVGNKEQVINSTINDCKVDHYNLGEMEFQHLSDTSVVLTYIVDQEGVCGGVKLDSKIRVSAHYIKQNKQWLEELYIESKIE